MPEEFEEALDDATTIVKQVLSLLPEDVHPVTEDSCHSRTCPRSSMEDA